MSKEKPQPEAPSFPHKRQRPQAAAKAFKIRQEKRRRRAKR